MSKLKLLTSGVDVEPPLAAPADITENLVGVIAIGVVHNHHLTHQWLDMRRCKSLRMLPLLSAASCQLSLMGAPV